MVGVQAWLSPGSSYAFRLCGTWESHGWPSNAASRGDSGHVPGTTSRRPTWLLQGYGPKPLQVFTMLRQPSKTILPFTTQQKSVLVAHGNLREPFPAVPFRKAQDLDAFGILNGSNDTTDETNDTNDTANSAFRAEIPEDALWNSVAARSKGWFM